MEPAPRIQLTDAQRLDWLRLSRSESVGPRTFRALINRYGGARRALEALPEIAARSGRTIAVCTVADAEREFAEAAQFGVRYLAMGEDGYSFPLTQIADAPPLIGVRGDVAVLKRPAVAIVGSRNASAAGLRVAEILARGVGEQGYVVVSGLARGIDGKAHEAALDSGTIAVIAGGHDRLYPAEHAPLVERILDRGGAVVTEMPMGWTPRGRDFPRRNRIVSGLALGVVVVEAARKSGSLITARFALEQGREVFAAPGSPLDPRAEGTNDLIRQGATLAAAPEHVTSELAPLLPPVREARAPGEDEASPAKPPRYWGELDLPPLAEPGVAAPSFPGWEGERDPAADAPLPAGRRLLALLSVSPVEVDELARLSEVPVREVRAMLAELELAGRIERHGANRVSLRA